MKLAFFIVAVLVSVSAMADEDVKLSPELEAKCKAAGGCVLIPKRIVDELLQDAYQAGIKKAAEDGKTCKGKDWT